MKFLHEYENCKMLAVLQVQGSVEVDVEYFIVIKAHFLK
jgi:hypothetical protein